MTNKKELQLNYGNEKKKVIRIQPSLHGISKFYYKHQWTTTSTT